jgi:O-antigen ligase
MAAPAAVAPTALIADPRLYRPATRSAGSVLIALPIIVLIVAGMATGLTILTLVGALAALAVAVVAPATGLLVAVFIAALDPTTVIPAPGLNLALVGALLVGCIFRLPIDRPALTVPTALLLLTCFFGFILVQLLPEAITLFTSSDRAHYVGFLFFQIASSAGLVWACSLIMARRPPWPYLAMVFGAAGLGAVIAVLIALDPSWTTRLGTMVAENEAGGGRASGVFGNPNYYGAFLASAITAALGTRALVPGRRWRRCLDGLIVLLTIVLLLSLSRGGLVATFAGITVLAFLRDRRTGWIVLAAGGLLAVVAYPLFIEHRVALTSGAEASSLLVAQSDASRLGAVLAGPELFLTSPLVGIRFGQYSEQTGISSHNWYMAVLAEQGLIGIVLWAGFLLAVIALIRRRPKPVARIGLAVLVSHIVSSLFTNMAGSYQASSLLIVVVTAVIVADWGLGDRDGAREGRDRPRWAPAAPLAGRTA